MANRREEERERLRQAREQRETKQSRSDRRRLMLGYGIAGVIGAIVLIGIVVAVVSSLGSNDGGKAHINLASGSTNGIEPDLREGPEPPAVKVTDMKEAAKAAGCNLRLELRDEGKNHLPVTATEPSYSTNPPVSGDHAEPPYQEADGAYSEPVKPLFFLHSLEHGRMAIMYSPDLDQAAQEELKGLYDTMYAATLLFPDEKMPYEVAAVTWTNLMGCDEYKGAATMDAIRAFGKETWGQYGNEPVAAFTFTGPSPESPALK
ncbi:MAG TPA: DUF3105 domain-containing protein [Solirubrobacterales bacterium]